MHAAFAHLTEAGIRWRWPNGIPLKPRADIERNLKLIES